MHDPAARAEQEALNRPAAERWRLRVAGERIFG
jgi:hypothetical protein